jgi:hypothetical protein
MKKHLSLIALALLCLITYTQKGLSQNVNIGFWYSGINIYSNSTHKLPLYYKTDNAIFTTNLIGLKLSKDFNRTIGVSTGLIFEKRLIKDDCAWVFEVNSFNPVTSTYDCDKRYEGLYQFLDIPLELKINILRVKSFSITSFLGIRLSDFMLSKSEYINKATLNSEIQSKNINNFSIGYNASLGLNYDVNTHFQVFSEVIFRSRKDFEDYGLFAGLSFGVNYKIQKSVVKDSSL